MKTTAIMALALAGLAAIQPATAQVAQSAIVRATIRHADLDLAQASHVRKLDRRIGQAARTLCGAASQADIEGGNEVRRCRSTIRAGVADKRRDLILAARQPNGTSLTAR